jgi:hypothetical protein
VGGGGRREVVLTIGDYGALDDEAEQVPTLGEMQAFESNRDVRYPMQRPVVAREPRKDTLACVNMIRIRNY